MTSRFEGIRMRSRLLTATLVAAGLVSESALSQEFCFDLSGQFANSRYCVSSVRAPQGGTNFGPENLLAIGDGAWCASADGKQIVTMYFKPKPLFRTITITNGYAKSKELFFRQNGRVKRALLEADNGYKSTITLRDISAGQRVIIPKGRYGWIRLTILDSAKGSANSAVCLSEFLANLEELGND